MAGGLLIGGDYYLNPKNAAGVYEGLIGPLNTTKMAITHPEPDKKERISRRQATLGQALDTIYISKPDEIEIAVDDQPAAMLAMLFSAETETITEASGSVTDEAVSMIPGRWTKLAHRNIDTIGIELATVAAPTVALVEGTDYEVNHAAGLVRAIEGGAIAAITACLIDYDHSAVSGTRFNASRRTSVPCKILMEGINKVNGEPCLLEVDEAVLYSSSEIDFASGEYITTTLKGTLTTVEGAGEPYRYESLTMA